MFFVHATTKFTSEKILLRMKMRVLRVKMMISRGLITKEEENNLFFNVLFSIDGKVNVSAAKKL